MKTVVHRVTAWLLACTLALGLAACGDITPEDAETYIQGLLDASYLGQYDQDYLDLAGITEEESREEDYEWNTTAEADILRDYLAIQPTDAAVQQSVDLVKEIYSHSKYEVGAASKLDDGSYAVTVSVQPMDILIRYQNQTDVNEVWLEVLAEHGVTDQAALTPCPTRRIWPWKMPMPRLCWTASARCCLKWAMGLSSRWCCSCSWKATHIPWWGPTGSIWTA